MISVEGECMGSPLMRVDFEVAAAIKVLLDMSGRQDRDGVIPEK